MNTKLLLLQCALPAAFLGALSAPVASAPAPALVAAASPYTIVDLGPYDPNNGGPAAVNNSGQVVGSTYNATTQQFTTILSGPGGAMPFKSLAAGTEAGGINDSGQICGQFMNVAGLERVFLSGPNGGSLKELGTFDGGYSDSSGVNSSGQVAGSSTVSGNSHAFLSGPNGGALHDLGLLTGKVSTGTGVNDSGQVCGIGEIAGASIDGTYLFHAFLSGPGGGPLHDLGTFGGPVSAAYRVNSHGQVTGFADTISGAHAFLSAPNGGPLRDLGTLGGDYSIGEGVNTAGQVAGLSTYPGGSNNSDLSDTHAFLYTSGVMTDLNRYVSPTSGIVLSAATLSDSGYILAVGTLFGQTHGFLLAPNALTYTGPNLVVTAVSSVLVNTLGTRYVAVTVTNNGGRTADLVQITGITLNGLNPPAGDIHNVLPTIPNLLPPGQSETDTVVYQVPLTATRAVLSVGGIYTDPLTNGTGHFGTTIRLVLP